MMVGPSLGSAELNKQVSASCLGSGNRVFPVTMGKVPAERVVWIAEG